MNQRQIWVKFSEEFNKQYRELQVKVLEEKKKGIDKSFYQQLLKAIDKETDNLKTDPQQGIHIPHRYITKKVFEKYRTKDLWKVNLPDHWRMIYTLTGTKIEVIALILDMTDHDKYNKLFDYRKN